MDIELRDITKTFGPVIANSSINLKIKGGEILGLLGENGAGKTTLMNILSGLYQPDSGKILIDGIERKFSDPGEAIENGIGMVHQHFMLVPVFSVTENVILGIEPKGRFNYLAIDEAHKQVKEISAKYSLEVDPKELVNNLPVGSQQRVEIIKVLFRSAKVLVFDEPTAVLTPQEVLEFFKIIKTLKASGKAIIFISHKLNEVIKIVDRISILRSGKIVGEANPKTSSDKKLASLMVGRTVKLNAIKKKAQSGQQPILTVENLCIFNKKKEKVLSNINFNVCKGEIVGLAGVQGNGQTELVQSLTGNQKPSDGKFTFFNKNCSLSSPRQLHKMGIRHIPEDRQRSGIISNFSISENMILNTYYQDEFSKGAILKRQQIRDETKKMIQAFDVRTPSEESEAGKLSGGNQQKLVVGREMSENIKFLIASQPTRGVDVGSIEYIHKQIINARDTGNGILLVSTELEEIMTLSDRILVIFRGKIFAEFNSKASVSEIGLAMAGIVA